MKSLRDRCDIRALELETTGERLQCPVTWPGGYPIAYACADGDTLCAGCARDPENPAGFTDETEAEWRIVAYAILEGDEGDEGETCDHCGAMIGEDA